MVTKKNIFYSYITQYSFWNKDDKKKAHAYNMFKNLNNMTSLLVFTTINDKKVLWTSFHSEEIAKEACIIFVLDKESTTFQWAETFKKLYNKNHFQIHIQDVLLDTDKRLFEELLSKIDKIISICY